MIPRSPFLRWLLEDPQGTDGTGWTLLATEDDIQVSTASGTGMSAMVKYRYRSRQRLGHAAMLRATSGNYAAQVWRREDPVWRLDETVPAPVAVTAAALTAGLPDPRS